MANCLEVDDLLDCDFSAEELDIGIVEDEIGIVVDEPPEIDETKETITELWRVYQLGKHRLMCGSSTEASDVETLMNKEEVDQVVTDQPYNVDYQECIIWIKNSSVLSRQDYNWKHEPILYGWKPGEAHYFCNDFTKTTVIDDDVDITKLGKQELLDMVKKFQKLQ